VKRLLHSSEEDDIIGEESGFPCRSYQNSLRSEISERKQRIEESKDTYIAHSRFLAEFAVTYNIYRVTNDLVDVATKRLRC
jgi:hypothetical protein